MLTLPRCPDYIPGDLPKPPEEVFEPPTAAFHANVTSGDEGITINFSDDSISDSEITDWYWTFGTDEGTSELQNPSHTYNTAGSYTVSLKVTNAYGSDTETKTNYITITEEGVAPVAAFTADDTTVDEGDYVQFTDQSANGPTSWYWDFGDDTYSYAQNPSHQYDTADTYTVSLEATNDYGSDTETKTDYITVTKEEYTYSKTKVSSTELDHGAFYAKTYSGSGHLYIGTYRYPNTDPVKCLMFDYDGSTLHRSSESATEVEESIAFLEEFGAYLYANTEDDGVIRRRPGVAWSTVYNHGEGGCAMAVFNSYLYEAHFEGGTNYSYIYRSSNGTSWNKVWEGAYYIRNLQAYDGKIYAHGIRNSDEDPFVFKSSTGNSGTWTREAVVRRFMRSTVWNDYMWLGAAHKDHHVSVGKAGIWRYNGSIYTRVYEDAAEEYGYITGLKVWNNKLFAVASQGWKDDDQNERAGLFMSQTGASGTWTKVLEFDEPCAWGLEVWNGHLYVGTWKYISGGDKGGYLYKITETEV